MPVDPRREMEHIHDEYERYYRQIGEEIVWFQFDPEGSRWDDLFDEGGRTYKPGVRLPALWVDQIEDPEQYSSEGRRPRQRFRCAVSARELVNRGIGHAGEEAHGRRLDDPELPAPSPAQDGRPLAAWLDDRLNDVLFYDRRFYAVSNFQIRGRAQFADAIIGVSALELIPDDESVYDFFPGNTRYANGRPYEPVDTGVALSADAGVEATFSLTFPGTNADMRRADWTFKVSSEGSIVATVAPDNVDHVNGEAEVTIPDTLGAGSFTWELTKTFGVVAVRVLHGTLELTN